MGTGSSKKVSCPNCPFKTGHGHKFVTHLAKVHTLKCMKCTKCAKCGEDGFSEVNDNITSHNHDDMNETQSTKNVISCPKCSQSDFENTSLLLDHLEEKHYFTENKSDTSISCPKCNKEGFDNCEDLVEHLNEHHSFGPTQTSIVCPKCSQTCVSTEAFLEHIQHYHAFQPSMISLRAVAPSTGMMGMNKNLPKVGDKIIAMWSVSMWQYFHATIRSYKAESLRYLIDWDDGDTTGKFHSFKIFLSLFTTCQIKSLYCVL